MKTEESDVVVLGGHPIHDRTIFSRSNPSLEHRPTVCTTDRDPSFLLRYPKFFRRMAIIIPRPNSVPTLVQRDGHWRMLELPFTPRLFSSRIQSVERRQRQKKDEREVSRSSSSPETVLDRASISRHCWCHGGREIRLESRRYSIRT